jgi:hypothetical protein
VTAAVDRPEILAAHPGLAELPRPRRLSILAGDGNSRRIHFTPRRRPMKVLAASLTALVACLCSLSLSAAEPAAASVALFDGKTLDGWTVLGCEAEVQDGAILIKAGNGLVQSKEQYADFVLEVEWKALQKERWDSGIYIRYDVVPKGRPWPPVYQVNLAQGDEGNLVGNPAGKSKGLVKDHEWNRFRLTVRGTKAALEINGKPAWEADGLKQPKGFIALQAEVPAGGQFLFRNVRLTRL